jgi:CRP/FNR family nitrogen fixation transcriptional regulator
MLTQSLSTTVIGNNKISPVAYPTPTPDQFGAVTGHAGLIATEFSYRKDEEIYGEDEPAEYVYQVISGAVRSYKLLSDGRRQIGAFHLAGDVFGLESGTIHRLAAEAIIDTTVRLVKRRSLEQAAGIDVQVARKLWAMTAGDLRHAEDHMLLLGRKTATALKVRNAVRDPHEEDHPPPPKHPRSFRFANARFAPTVRQSHPV